MAKSFLLTLLLISIVIIAASKESVVKSPDGKISVVIDIDNEISYKVFFNEIAVLNKSTIAFEYKQDAPIGKDLIIVSSETYKSDEIWKPVLKRFEFIRDNHQGIRLVLKEKKFPQRNIILDFRVFNDGMAFRTEFPAQFGNHESVLMNELTTFNFSGNHTCWAVNYGGYTTSQEAEHFKRNLSEITPEMVIGLPLTVKVDKNCFVAISEADLEDYAGMYLKSVRGDKKNIFYTALSPRKGQPENGEKVKYVTPHKTPWRVIIIGENASQLVESEIIANLNEPCAIKDPTWIKPGISAWDHWWSGEVKMEQDIIIQYIDLASEMGWQYMLIDWQWYGQFNKPGADITRPAAQLNMPEILDYAKSKNVRCWLWLYNTDIDRADFDKACALYEKWGIAGIKIDFMDSDDQERVNWYYNVVKTAANYHLLVDFHGAYKPTGEWRTWPNWITREGVLGNEYNKWSLRITPEHLCTLPFTRMLAGPMDFTPGGFLNRNPDKFLNGTPANVMNTRANTLAQFVIFDSPFTVACDHPDNYQRGIGAEFLKKVKAEWDDTKVLNGEPGEYITTMRRYRNSWFIGSITNSEAREIEIKLDFLPAGNFKLISFTDTSETTRDAEIAKRTETSVKKGDVVKMNMVPGGGFAAWIE